jgi:hypothetical protein
MPLNGNRQGMCVLRTLVSSSVVRPVERVARQQVGPHDSTGKQPKFGLGACRTYEADEMVVDLLKLFCGTVS